MISNVDIGAIQRKGMDIGAIQSPLPADPHYFMWSTNAADGTSASRFIDGQVRVYKNANTESTTVGVTDIEDFDSITGIHSVKVDPSQSTFYTDGTDYQVVIVDTGVDGIQDINSPIGRFRIEDINTQGKTREVNPGSKYRKRSVSWYIEDPTAGNTNLLARYIPHNATINEIIFGTDTGTVEFNVELRGKFSALNSGTDILTTDDFATSTGESVTSFNTSAISATSWLALTINSVSGNPTKFFCDLIYTIN